MFLITLRTIGSISRFKLPGEDISPERITLFSVHSVSQATRELGCSVK